MSSEGIEDIGLLKIALIIAFIVVVIIIAIARRGESSILNIMNTMR